MMRDLHHWNLKFGLEGVNEDPEDVSKRIKNIFEDVKRKYREVKSK